MAEHLTPDLLDDVEAVVFNSQAGTKQMSFGAWDALQDSLARLPDSHRPQLLRCFVAPGTVTLDSGEKRSVRALSLKEHLQLYGYVELADNERRIREDWMLHHRVALLRFAEARLRGRNDDAERTAGAIFAQRAPWRPDDFLRGGYWLEILVYLKALERRAIAGRHGHAIYSGVKIRDVTAPSRIGDGARLLNDYEIDLVVVGPGAIHIVECKSGKIERAHVDLLEVLRRRLQGHPGVSLLVSREESQDNATALGQKAKAANVSWVQASATNDTLDAALDRIFA